MTTASSSHAYLAIRAFLWVTKDPLMTHSGWTSDCIDYDPVTLVFAVVMLSLCVFDLHKVISFQVRSLQPKPFEQEQTRWRVSHTRHLFMSEAFLKCLSLWLVPWYLSSPRLFWIDAQWAMWSALAPNNPNLGFSRSGQRQVAPYY